MRDGSRGRRFPCVVADEATVPEETTESKPVTVVLADDHVMVRNGIRMVLEAEGGIEVVAEAADAEEAARRTLGHKPDILLLDLSMPGLPAIEAIPKIVERSPDTAIIVLTMQKEPAFARQALQSGARGYVIKHSAAAELVNAIHAVLEGETYINPALGARIAAEPEDQVLPTSSPRARARSSASWHRAT